MTWWRNPLCKVELTIRMESPKLVQVHFFYLLLLWGILFLGWPQRVETVNNLMKGETIDPLLVLSFCQVGLVTYFSSSLASGNIVLEKEDLSPLDLVVHTGLKTNSIIAGKLYANLFCVSSLTVVGLPLMLLGLAISPYTLSELGLVVALTFISGLTFALMGILFASLTKSKALKSLGHYLSILFLWLGTYVGDHLLRLPEGSYLLLYLNPFAATISLLKGAYLKSYKGSPSFWSITIVIYVLIDIAFFLLIGKRLEGYRRKVRGEKGEGFYR